MIHLRRLWLTDFRNYADADLELPPGTTAVVGANGQGKTNLLEAVAWLSGTALRGATTEVLVRTGAPRAVVRAEARRGARELLLEAELVPGGRNRIQLNRQPVRRQRDLLEAVTVTVFSPDDLALVKGGPGERRTWLDEAMAALDPRLDALRGDLDRILRQRGALLRQARGRLDESAALTLDVWDDRLARVGEQVTAERRRVLAALTPELTRAYRDLAGAEIEVGALHRAEWSPDGSGTGLGPALRAARVDDVRRGVTTVGPHRDDVAFTLEGRPTRTHASQGEQRSLALALRLAVHRAVREASGDSPVLLLDDVLSELDESRTTALLHHLPPGQTLLTTASRLPPGVSPELVLRVDAGRLRRGAPGERW